jgi:hypothetical protein
MPGNLVIIKLQGGLGNQMFQYAFGRSLADKFDRELFLDCTFLRDRTPVAGFTRRDYELSHFSVRAEIADEKLIRSIAAYPKTRFDFYKKRLLKLTGRVNFSWEDTFTFNPAVNLSAATNYLTGFWQSEQYFNYAAENIRNDFKLKKAPDQANQDHLRRIKGCAAVSVHIRRGDYVNNPSHPVCDSSYYKDAITLSGQLIKEPVYFIFSDDIEWVKGNLDIAAPNHIIDVNAHQSHFELFLMSNCRHHIIANSSFSWWAAWLNPNLDKVVIAPKRWFNDPAMDTTDLIPENWITI